MRKQSWVAVCSLLVGCGGAESAESGGTACDPTAEPSHTVACVESFVSGEGAGFGQESFPEIIYGEPKGGGVHGGSTDVLSLGKGGSIAVGFGGTVIADGPGADFIVFENAFYIGDNPEKPFKELGEVSVSEDGATWVTFPCKQDAYPYEGCAGWHAVLAGSAPRINAFDPEEAGGDAFDLADVGVAQARFVRVVDVSMSGATPSAGFDLDAMAVVNGTP